MNHTGKIILIPTSGLANRMRIMAVAVKLARKSGKKILVYWQKNSELSAHFEDIFEIPSGIIVREIPVQYKIWLKMRRYSSKLFGLDKWYVNRFQFDFVFLDSLAEKVWHNKLNLQQEVDKAKNVLICSCQEFNYFELEDYHRLFVPKDILQQSIDKLSQKFTSNTIGVHIRATDNKASNEFSPFSVFIKEMEKEIDRNSEVTFFVATDEEKYQEKILEKFGRDRVLYHEKVFGRNVTAGIQDAVIDLFCLSKTSKIYGSYFSSFSMVAGRIGNIPVEVLKEENKI